MSVDRTKILEAAQKHLAKGAYDKAIAEFQKLVRADPSDVRTWLKIGDLHAKRGSTKDAVDTYAKVADQYASQGFFLKAVAVHKQILKLDPTRLDVHLKLAEAYENLQLVSDALATYEQVAGAYARAGNIDKALETLGKMVELDSENIPIRIKYAEALSKAGRTKDAAGAFEAGAKLLEAQGRIDDWIKVAERLLFHRPDDVAVARELSRRYLERDDAKRALAKLQICFKADPKDVPTLEMLADAFHQLGQLPKTISVHREIARIHQEAGRAEERARTLKRILELDPGDAEARQALAAYAQSPGASGAGAQQAVQAAPPVRRDIAPPPGAVIGSRAGARPAPEAEEIEELDEEAIDEDVLAEAEDEYPEASYGEASGDYDGADADYDEVAAAAEGAEDVIIVDDDDGVPASSRRPAAGPSAPSAAGTSNLPPEIAREAQIAKLLTECEVFLRYGLKQKVVDQLRRVLEIDAAHVEARERLKDLLIERGEIAAAVGELVVLADLFAADRPPVATLYLRQALELDPGEPAVTERLAALGAAEQGVEAPLYQAGAGAAPAAAGHALAGVPDERTVWDPEAPAAEPEEGVFFVDDEDAAARAEERFAVPPPARELDASEWDQVEPTMAGAPESLPHVHVAQPDADAHTHATPVPAPLERPAPSGDPLAPISPEEFESAPLRPSAPEVVADQAARMSMPPGEVEELLDEADFFVAQGLYDEAKAILRDSLAAHPRNVLIGDKLAEIEELAAQHQVASRSVPPPEGDQSFELAERLAEDLGEAEAQARDAGSDVLDVEQVFAQFKKGVEQQVGLEDTETHFDLGIAYKEMGLVQDAIAEFQLCLANPQKQCIAHTMIGLCHFEKGDVAEAIGHFKKGLYAEHKTDREELGLYYELGRAYEQLHDPKEALYYFEKVRKRDPSFRNVNDRILALTRPTPAAAQASPSIANDDIDAAFDDLMGDRES